MNTYDLAVKLSLSSAGLAAGAAMAMSSFSNIKGAAASADAAVLRHQATLDKMTYFGVNQQSLAYKSALYDQATAANAASAAHTKLSAAQRSATMIGAGVATFAIGMGGVDVLDHWVKSAGALEVAMNNVRLATGATNDQLQAMQRGDIKIALSNQMSITDVETLRATAAQNNLHNIPQLSALLPELARFAEVMKVTKGYSPEQSATTGVSFAHVFSGYTAAQISPLLDQFSRALQTTHATPSQFLTTLSGFVGTARSMYGTSPAQRALLASDSIAMTALLGNMGQGTRGGTQMRALLASTMDTLARPDAIHNQALHLTEKWGGGTFFHNGVFAGQENMLDILMKASKYAANPLHASELRRAMSTAGGGALAGLLADPQVVTLFQGIKKDISGKGSLFSLDAAQGFVNQTQQGRFNQLQANLETISALMGQKILPAVVAIATALAQLTAGVIDFIDQNPEIAKFAALFVAVSTAVALVAGPILIAAGAMGIMALAGVGITAALAPILVTIALVSLAVGGIILLFMNWGRVTQWLGGQWHEAAKQLKIFTDSVKHPFDIKLTGGGEEQVLAGIGRLAGEIGSGDWYSIFTNTIPKSAPKPTGAGGARSAPMGHGGGYQGLPPVNIHLHATPEQTTRELAEMIRGVMHEVMGEKSKELDDFPRYHPARNQGLHPSYRAS